MCEWKGAATYHILTNNSTNESVKAKIWSYASPTPGFKPIKDHLCFYASGVPWKCFVDGEEVKPQDGEFAVPCGVNDSADTCIQVISMVVGLRVNWRDR